MLFLVVKTATSLGSISMLILEPSGAINCVSWLFNDLSPCLSFEDFLFCNQLVTSLTGEVWFGCLPVAAARRFSGWGTAG